MYWYWFMPHTLDLSPHLFEFCPETFGDCLTTNCETIVFSATAYVRKPQKVKCFRLPYSSFLSVCFRKSSKFDKLGLLIMNVQTMVGKSILQFLQEPLCLLLMLKSHNEIVRAPFRTVILRYPHSVHRLRVVASAL